MTGDGRQGGIRRRGRRAPGPGRLRAWGLLVLGLVCLGVPVAAAWGASGRYSGQVRRVDLGLGVHGRLVVEELAERGRPRAREVVVTRDTVIVAVARRRAWAMRDRHLYGETPVTLVDVLAGDFVVVEWVEAGGQPVARRIAIVEQRVRER